MFGYIRPFQPDLRMRELEAYKAVYCGLCRQLGKRYGFFARFTLSYDFTFVAMLHYAVSAQPVKVERCRCPFNPLRKKRPMCAPDGVLAFGSDLAAIMLYYKVLDNIQDGRGLRRLGWRFCVPLVRRGWKKAAAARPDVQEIVVRSVERQREAEARGFGLDAACEPSAWAMSNLFALLAGGEDQRRVLERFGYLVGRYVYLCDALDDVEKDRKRGSFNPFLLRFEGEGPEQLLGAKQALYLTVSELASAFALLDLHQFGPILENVVLIGFRATVDDILRKKEQAL